MSRVSPAVPGQVVTAKRGEELRPGSVVVRAVALVLAAVGVGVQAKAARELEVGPVNVCGPARLGAVSCGDGHEPVEESGLAVPGVPGDDYQAEQALRGRRE